MIRYTGCGDAISRSLLFAAGRVLAEGVPPPLTAKLSKTNWAHLVMECPMALWREGDRTTVRLMACQGGITLPQYVALGVEFDTATEMGHATICTADGTVVAEVTL